MGVFVKLGNIADKAVEKAKEKVDEAIDKVSDIGKEDLYVIRIDGVMPNRYDKDELVKTLIDLGYVEVVDG